jgi:mannan endo-1,4-beta-mannosidase
LEKSRRKKIKKSSVFVGVFAPSRFKWFCVLFLSSNVFAGDINFLVMPDEVVGPISPYVYGLNAQDPLDTGATVRRLGGNRMTGYNWVNNASNAGSDWKHSNDDWLCNGLFRLTDCDQPGAVVTHFVEQNQRAGMDSLVTIPMAGFVAADKDGEVAENESTHSRRFRQILFFKRKKPFTLTPDPKNPVVYEDEFVNFLVNKLHPASQGGIKFYELDNEPGLWPTTHPRIHPDKTGYWELVNDRTDALATNILKQDPDAVIFGPVSYGWQGFLTLQNSPDSGDVNKTFGTFLDFYLYEIKHLRTSHHKRIVSVLDLHWYPEAQGAGKRVTLGDISPDSIDARLQAPRSLWDPGYMEKSWIADTWKKPIQLIPWLKEKIDKYDPGVKLAFTEYDYGAGDHVSGGLAQADVLGIFGKNGVFMSNYWGDLKPYNKAAFKIYRNYDGKGSAFGDTCVSSATENVIQTSVYAATDSKTPGALWLLVLNKNQKNSIHGKFQIQGKETYQSYQSYGFDSNSPEIKSLKKDKIDENKFDYSLPPLSATLLVCH